ncbi:PAAR domain-containing protein [Ralstonia sp. 25C]|uniref:PAAR domain-containing protein n=1 Tax=Ralstonia sp. 25C TaxID=3447363 RepID=UPI003F75176A
MQDAQGCDMERLSDATDHGGKLIEATEELKHLGIAVALDGHSVMCPKCDGVFPLLASGPAHASRSVCRLSRRSDRSRLIRFQRVRACKTVPNRNTVG